MQFLYHQLFQLILIYEDYEKTLDKTSNRPQLENPSSAAVEIIKTEFQNKQRSISHPAHILEEMRNSKENLSQI